MCLTLLLIDVWNKSVVNTIVWIVHILDTCCVVVHYLTDRIVCTMYIALMVAIDTIAFHLQYHINRYTYYIGYTIAFH